MIVTRSTNLADHIPLDAITAYYGTAVRDILLDNGYAIQWCETVRHLVGCRESYIYLYNLLWVPAAEAGMELEPDEVAFGEIEA